jgi:hypothetical protein
MLTACRGVRKRFRDGSEIYLRPHSAGLRWIAGEGADEYSAAFPDVSWTFPILLDFWPQNNYSGFCFTKRGPKSAKRP